jgi:hypothetical protein
MPISIMRNDSYGTQHRNCSIADRIFLLLFLNHCSMNRRSPATLPSCHLSLQYRLVLHKTAQTSSSLVSPCQQRRRPDSCNFFDQHVVCQQLRAISVATRRGNTLSFSQHVTAFLSATIAVASTVNTPPFIPSAWSRRHIRPVIPLR